MQHNTTTPQHFCLRWNNYQSNLTNVFDQLLQSETLVDVTLACDGHSVKAHKMVLSACSPYFQSLFFDNPCQHPIVIMKDIKWPELKAIVEFMYKGEINVSQEQISPLLRVAESLKIRGLADVKGEQNITARTDELTTTKTLLHTVNTMDCENRQENEIQPRPKKRRRHSGERSSPEVPEPPTSIEMPPAATPQQIPEPLTFQAHPVDNMEIKPSVTEIPRDEHVKMLESSNASWFGASSSAITDYPYSLKQKSPTWSQEQLKEAIDAVVRQKMRFTQASSRYGIPKGTLYDNILGKSNRMAVLEETGLMPMEEEAVLDFCCDVSISPYNRRTKKSLQSILDFVERIRRMRDPEFMFTGLSGFRWWWAFCKKHSIVSLFYDNGTH